MKPLYKKILFHSLSSCLFFHTLTAQNKQHSVPPVETEPPIAKGQQPAFAGQTRIAGVKTQTTVKITPIVTGLKNPWGLDFMSDGRMIVSERLGTIRIMSKEGLAGPAIQGV